MSRKTGSLVNRRLQTFLSQPFMKEREPEGPEPFGYQREMGWELMMDAVATLTRRLQENLPALYGEVVELLAVRAVADVASELTLATALKRATRRESLERMAEKMESEDASHGGKLVTFIPK